MPSVPVRFSWLDDAVAGGLIATALVHRYGKVLALAGALDADEVWSLVTRVMQKIPAAPERLGQGEILSSALDRRNIAIADAARGLLVVGVLASAAQIPIVGRLRDEIAVRFGGQRAVITDLPWSHGGSDGGSGSGPAELPVIEYGVTVRRGKA